jgi:hypothetical protein
MTNHNEVLEQEQDLFNLPLLNSLIADSNKYRVPRLLCMQPLCWMSTLSHFISAPDVTPIRSRLLAAHSVWGTHATTVLFDALGRTRDERSGVNLQ